MKILARKAIRDLKPYEPGKPIKELERELGIKEADIIKLASNENPIGPSPKAIKAIGDVISGINRYPDGGCFYLKQKLASKQEFLEANALVLSEVKRKEKQTEIQNLMLQFQQFQQEKWGRTSRRSQ